jgi:putative protein-disulfide isomerase
VQHAFYADGRDVTDFVVLTDIAAEHGVDRETFATSLLGDEAKRIAWDDFTRARNWGISGFPTLVGDLGDGRLALLARGFTEADTIRDRIRRLAEAG